MSYRCRVCGSLQLAGTPMKKLVKMRKITRLDSGRERYEVEAETPVCAECYEKHNLPTPLQPLSSKKLSQVVPLTCEQICAALGRGEKERDALEKR